MKITKRMKKALLGLAVVTTLALLTLLAVSQISNSSTQGNVPQQFENLDGIEVDQAAMSVIFFSEYFGPWRQQVIDTAETNPAQAVQLVLLQFPDDVPNQEAAEEIVNLLTEQPASGALNMMSATGSRTVRSLDAYRAYLQQECGRDPGFDPDTCAIFLEATGP